MAGRSPAKPEDAQASHARPHGQLDNGLPRQTYGTLAGRGAVLDPETGQPLWSGGDPVSPSLLMGEHPLAGADPAASTQGGREQLADDWDDEIAYRGEILPFARTEGGSTVPAWPGFLHAFGEGLEAVKRNAPEHGLNFEDWDTDVGKVTADIGLAEAGALSAGLKGVPRNAVGTFGGKRAKAADAADSDPVSPSLPMDDAARSSRAAALGYDDQPFYRGEKGAPSEYPGGAHFSRDREYAAGFAPDGEPREFRLNLERTFDDSRPLHASDMGRLIESALTHDPELANFLADLWDKTPEWMLEFSRRNPDVPLTEPGASTALIRQAIENSRDAVGVLRGAGYDAVGNARDVRKITGSGIRSSEAAFDPSLADNANIFHGNPFGAAAFVAVPTAPEEPD